MGKASLIAARRLYVPLGIDLGGPEFARKLPGTKWAAGSAKLRTYGDHVRARRLELGLYRREVANLLGVDKTTVYNWESNRNAPLWCCPTMRHTDNSSGLCRMPIAK